MSSPELSPAPQAPRAKIEPREFFAHGTSWRDDYAWIRAENWRETLADPAALPAEIRAHLEAENAYADEVLGPGRELEAELKREMRARMKEDDSDPPTPDGPWAYYTRFRPGGQHRICCRRPRGGGDEMVLFDGDARGQGKAFFQLAGARHSPDHRLYAWSFDDKGAEMDAIRVRDLEADADLSNLIENTTGEMVWARNSRKLLYILQDENHRPWRVMLHAIGHPATGDVLIYEEADPAWFIALQPTQLGRRAFILVHGHDASETWIVDLDDPALPPRLIAPRRPKLRYRVMDHGDVFYIRANASGADDFKIVTAPADAPEEANWRDYLPVKEGRIIEAAALFRHHLALLTRENAVPRLGVHDLDTGESREIAFDAETRDLGLMGGYEFDTTTLRFSFSSMATSEELYDYDMATGQRVMVKKQMTPADFDPSNYVVRRLDAPAPDGEKIPISLMMRKETPLDGSAPLMIYGYGAYGYGIDAGYSSNRFSWVDRGFVYAIAHVRGGPTRAGAGTKGAS